ncbi:MAG: type II toxin-antitoxin system VapC family toxin [Armatimonadota bacterium]
MEIADRLVCSNYILVETLALAQRRMGLSAVHALVNDVLPVFQVVWVQEPDHQAGLRILLASGQRKLSLVDCVSFAILRRLGIGRVFCFDEDFAEQGFKCLPE